MLTSKKALLAAGLLAGAAMMTGCTADTRPAATPTPQTPKITAQPADAKTDAQPAEETVTGNTALEENAENGEEEKPLTLEAGGKEIDAGAIREEGKLLLPLTETAEALGWKAQSEQTDGENEQKRIVTLEKDDSRITVSWTVSDNTAKNITWQKDGLLIPVNTMVTTVNGVIYVPALFFEEAADVSVSETENGVTVIAAEPENTPETQPQELDGNG